MTKESKEADARAFIRIWQTAENKDEVVKRTKLTWEDAQQRAHYYRTKGVPLRKFSAKRSDWESLAVYAKQLLEDK